MTENIHIGKKIEELLRNQHKTKRQLGKETGISASNASYLTTRESIDVRMLQRIGNALRYNFFKHFPIMEDSAGGHPEPRDESQLVVEKEKMIEELRGEIKRHQSQAEELKREAELLRQENGYLKEINGLLKGKK